MKRLFILLPLVLASLIGCQSGGETTGKVPYDKKYEFVVDVPGVDAQTIYDSISFWLNSEFPTEKIDVQKFNSNGRESGIFAYSLQNIAIEKQTQVGPFGGWWLAVDMGIMVQTKDGKYKVSWENININRITVNGHNEVLEKKLQTKLSRSTFDFFYYLIESKSHSLKDQIAKISQDW